MKFVAFQKNGRDLVGVMRGNEVFPLKVGGEELTLHQILTDQILDDVVEGRTGELAEEGTPLEEIELAPVIRRPQQIIGVGLNYVEHASDLEATQPDDMPVFFFKTANTVIGPEEQIRIPPLSERTTGEAELGMVVKTECRNVDTGNWQEYVAGFVTILDMTAEDILRKNTRYLQLSKVFDTFLSVGAQLLTPEEVGKVESLRVRTGLNGEEIGSNVVSNMKFPPGELLSFISSIIPLHPGDVITTGTPRAAALSDGDVLSAEISGFIGHQNPVTDMKRHQ